MTSSLLFVPANAPDKFAKARAGEAHALILDLEDSVPQAGKAEARQNVVRLLAAAPAGPQQIWVRVNAAASGLLLQDLAAVVAARPFGIVLPKCCGRESLEPVGHYLDALEAAAGIPLGSTKILAIVTETAQSLFRLGDLAGVTPRLWGLAWGGEDLSADVGALSNTAGGAMTEPYRLARSLCLFAAAAAGVRAIDAVCVELRDADRVRGEAEEALRDGFAAKMAVHPAQLAPIHAAFQYPPEKLEWARRVVAAFEQEPSRSALEIDGRMVDAPHLKLARRMLATLRPA